MAGRERNLISGNSLRFATGLACGSLTTGGAVLEGIGLAAIPTRARQKITETASQNPSAINRTIPIAIAMIVPGEIPGVFSQFRFHFSLKWLK